MTQTGAALDSNLQEQPRKSAVGYDVVRFVLAGVLLVAASLKAYQLATGPLSGDGLLNTRWFVILVVELEFIFSFWLFAGLLPRWTWRIASACVGAFACLSLYKALSGHSSCGCFGNVQVNPWITFALDICLFGLLMWFPPGKQSNSAAYAIKPRVIAFVATSLIVGAVAGWAMLSFEAAAVDDAGDIVGDSQFVVLEPEQWIGKPFPLSQHIRIDADIQTGHWLVVLFHHDCSTCREAIPGYQQMATQATADTALPRIALIEMPPYALPQHRAFDHAQSTAAVGQLVDHVEWFVTTPTRIEIIDGIVKNSQTGKHASQEYSPSNATDERENRRLRSLGYLN